MARKKTPEPEVVEDEGPVEETEFVEAPEDEEPEEDDLSKRTSALYDENGNTRAFTAPGVDPNPIRSYFDLDREAVEAKVEALKEAAKAKKEERDEEKAEDETVPEGSEAD